MERNNLIKKGVAVAFILLFIGLAFAPSINANISKASVEDELVEFTTEVCGLNGGKKTVKLTQEEAEEVEALFDSIRERLNNTETREEAEEVFKEAVGELDMYGLLGGLSVKQAQKLVIGNYQNQNFKHLFENAYNKNLVKSEDSNYLCLISGSSDITTIIGPFTCLSALHYAFILIRGVIIGEFLGEIFILLIKIFGIDKLIGLIADIIDCVYSTIIKIRRYLIFNTALFVHRIPLKIGSFITFGLPSFDPWGSPRPACGDIVTFGLNGKKVWSGEFFGDIFPYIGVSGFTGLKIINEIGNNAYFGFAYKIKIDSEPPYQ